MKSNQLPTEAALAPRALPVPVTRSKLRVVKSIVWCFPEVSDGAGKEESGEGRKCREGEEAKTKPKEAFPYSL